MNFLCSLGFLRNRTPTEMRYVIKQPAVTRNWRLTRTLTWLKWIVKSENYLYLLRSEFWQYCFQDNFKKGQDFQFVFFFLLYVTPLHRHDELENQYSLIEFYPLVVNFYKTLLIHVISMKIKYNLELIWQNWQTVERIHQQCTKDVTLCFGP